MITATLHSALTATIHERPLELERITLGSVDKDYEVHRVRGFGFSRGYAWLRVDTGRQVSAAVVRAIEREGAQ